MTCTTNKSNAKQASDTSKQDCDEEAGRGQGGENSDILIAAVSLAVELEL